MSSYVGSYINLDYSIDRRIFIEHQLRQANILHLYKRFTGIKGENISIASKLTNAEFGCKQSHINILKEHKLPNKHIHIIEDDIHISQHHDELLEQFFKVHKEQKWDILFTGFQIPMIPAQIDFLTSLYDEQHKGIHFFDMKNFLFVGLFSYIVNKNSINKLLDIYDKSSNDMPVDFILRHHICSKQDIKAYSVFPMFVRHGGDFETTMCDREYELTYQYQYLFQKPFTVNVDIKEVFQEIQQYAHSIKYEIKNTDINIKNIYDILLNMGRYIIKTPNIYGKYASINS